MTLDKDILLFDVVGGVVKFCHIDDCTTARFQMLEKEHLDGLMLDGGFAVSP